MKLRKKIPLAFLCAALLCGCGSITIDESHLLANGDYYDYSGWNSTLIRVRKQSPLEVFGIPQSEWEAKYGDISIYKAYSQENTPLPEVVENNGKAAIRVVGKHIGAKYFALLDPGVSSEVTSSNTTVYDTSTINTSVGNKNVSQTTIQTPRTETYSVTHHTFESYVLFFNKDEDIKTMRDEFGVTNIFEN